jgi:hypothetical protein
VSTEGAYPLPSPPPEMWEEERTFTPKRAARRRTSEHRCDAAFLRGGRCHFAAHHVHRTQGGDLLQLCGVHLRTIKRRERLGSDEELTARWRER